MTEWTVRRSGDQASSWKITTTEAVGSFSGYFTVLHSACRVSGSDLSTDENIC